MKSHQRPEIILYDFGVICVISLRTIKVAARRPKRAYTDIEESGMLNDLKASTRQHANTPARWRAKKNSPLLSSLAWRAGVLACARVSSIYPFRDIGLLSPFGPKTEGAGQRRALGSVLWRPLQRRKRQRRAVAAAATTAAATTVAATTASATNAAWQHHALACGVLVCGPAAWQPQG